MKITKKYEAKGIVQGVGFRPFVYSLAIKYNLKGFVQNSSDGVLFELEGESVNIKLFEDEFKSNLPPLAQLDSLHVKEVNFKNYQNFQIIQSRENQNKSTAISPDMSMCDDCLSEFLDKKNRRFGYPLINCTNCGPRYSITYTVPYDRANTSMNKFEMCEECRAEYENPLNRRYHAQPISCPKCGPKIEFVDLKTKTKTLIEPLLKLSQAIKNGKIVALKGMGGFHIICDAINEKTVQLLREKKRRETKPFALLFKNLEEIKKHCFVDEFEEKELLSQARPIVLLYKKDDISLAKNIAPNIDRLGCFLPYTPLHVKLFEYLNSPIIATSANLSGEPIITDSQDLEEKLGNIIDCYVDFDRDIVNFSDDSVLQIVDKKPLYLRVSRGLAPKSFKTNFTCKEKILALGAHQKSTIAIYQDKKITISPYIADLDNIASIEAYQKTIETFKRFYDFEPTLLVCDKHPTYASTLFAKKQNLPLLQVQHHYTHILSAMFEYGLNEDILGISWDGTGYGDDGTIWGGEFFLCTQKEYKRVASLKPFKLLGESSIKHIDKIAFSLLYELKNDLHVKEFLDGFDKEKYKMLEHSFLKNINVFSCSSIGRLFDGVAAIILKKKQVSYDGESGLMLEALYDKEITSSYVYHINNLNQIDINNILLAILVDEPRVAVSKFFNTLKDIVLFFAKKYGKKVVLSGGVFQNKTLLLLIIKEFKKEKIDYFVPSVLSVNDSSISLGQMVYALNMKD
ncbi:MAG: carbamoyltransferase HypF [Campylobacteraceae bacterium]